MLLLWLSLLTSLHYCASHDVSTPIYRVTQFNSNPGIYYEYVNDIRLIRTQWRITITLDFSKLQDESVNRNEQLDNLINSCSIRLGYQVCSYRIPADKLKRKLTVAQQLHQELLEFFTPAVNGLDKNENRRKKRAPFEFVGWIDRTLFGTMDADDRKEVNDEVNKLYQKTEQISLLAANQTHIIKSNLEKINSVLSEDQAKYDRLINKISDFHKQNILLREAANRTMYSESVNKWIAQYEESLDFIINSRRTLINAVETTAKGHLHPLLLTHEQLLSIVNDINTYRHDHSLPWEESEISIEKLYELSSTSAIVRKGRLLIVLSFPLTGKERYSNYLIHPLPIANKIHSELHGYISIKPKIEYLAINHVPSTSGKKEYFQPKPSFLKNCQKDGKSLLCSPYTPIQKGTGNNSCEYSIYTNPSQAALRTCDISMHKGDTTYWTKLITTDEWLFSTIKPVTLNLICNGTNHSNITLTGAGIFALHGQCTAYTPDLILYGINNIKLNQTDVYQPELNFHLPSVLHINYIKFNDSSNTSLVFEEEEKREINNWAESNDAISLGEIEQKFTDIAHQRGANFRNTMITSTTFGVNFFLIAIITFIVWRYIRKRNSENSTNKTEITVVTPPTSEEKLRSNPITETVFNNPFLYANSPPTTIETDNASTVTQYSVTQYPLRYYSNRIQAKETNNAFTATYQTSQYNEPLKTGNPPEITYQTSQYNEPLKTGNPPEITYIQEVTIPPTSNCPSCQSKQNQLRKLPIQGSY